MVLFHRQFTVPLCLSLLGGCTFNADASATPVEVSNVTFTSGLSQANAIDLRQRTIRALTTTHQLRGAAGALEGALMDDPHFAVGLVGPCAGAVTVVRDLIEDVSTGQPYQQALLQEFSRTAHCEQIQPLEGT